MVDAPTPISPTAWSPSNAERQASQPRSFPTSGAPESSLAKGDSLETQAVTVTPPPPDPLAAVRHGFLQGDLETVAQLIDAFAEDLRSRPEVHLARAEAAYGLGDYGRARLELDQVQDATLVPEVGELSRKLAWKAPITSRLEAELGKTPEREASLLRAIALHADGQNERAEAALSAWLRAQKSKRSSGPGEARKLELRARTERAAVSQALGSKATLLEDYRFLATEYPEASAAQTALAELEAQGIALTPAQKRMRLEHLAERGDVATLESEFQSYVMGSPPREGDLSLLRARAKALYGARNCALARAGFEELARLDPGRSQEHRYFAARCSVRLNENGRARTEYQKLASGSGAFADHASYQLARLDWLMGERASALSGVASYLARFGKSGRNAARARYDLAIFSLAQGDAARAVRGLEHLRNQDPETRGRARLDELLGYAHHELGNALVAQASFRRSIEADPLSLSAAISASRLRALGEVVPPALEPPPVKALVPFDIALPSAVARLKSVGLGRDSELNLRRSMQAMSFLSKDDRRRAECELFGKLERAELRYRLAQTNASVGELRYLPSGPSRWHWDCLYPRPYSELVEEAAAQSRISSALIYAVMRQESAFRTEVSSPVGAVGLMQLMPQTAARAADELGLALKANSLLAPAPNIRLGAHYLARLLALFPGQTPLAVAAYNAGPEAVISWLTRFGDLPLDLFVAAIPYDETRNYVYRVMANLARYELLMQGELPDPQLALELPPPPAVGPDLY